MSLDQKRKQVEIIKLEASKAELELKIEESLENINRLKEHIKLTDERIEKLKSE